MSDVSLADSALSDLEAQPVGSDAPEVLGEVGNGSASNGQAPEGYIEKARFDGLMGRFNRTQNELQQARASIESLQSAREEEPVSDPAVAQQLQTLTDLLLRERAENARNTVLADHPELKPFADLLVADSPEELREVAQVFSERLKQVTGATSAEDPAPVVTDPAPEVPAVDAGATDPVVQASEPVVTGGTATFDGGAGIQERIDQATEAKNFPEYLALIRQRAVLAAEGVLEQD